jgi:CubicO group peptidase (beta-lactamase class C family)
VLSRIDSQLDDTVPAKGSITVRDLLTSCFGFGSVMAMPGTYFIQQLIRDGHLGGDGPPHPVLMPGTDEWMRRLGELPLMYQPGERWLYNTSCDVLGVLIARVSGESFESFLRKRLFDPLGMKDTAFSVPASKFDRLPSIYQFNHESKKLEEFDSLQNSEYSRPPAFESGAGGLVSTVDDYYMFCRMMLNKGVWRLTFSECGSTRASKIPTTTFLICGRAVSGCPTATSISTHRPRWLTCAPSIRHTLPPS